MRKTVIFSLNLLASGAHFHSSGLSDVLPSLPPSLPLCIPTCECPKKGIPPHRWKILKTTFQRCELSRGFLHKKYIFCQYVNLSFGCDYAFYIHGCWSLQVHGGKCEVRVRLHKQLLSNSSERLGAKTLNLCHQTLQSSQTCRLSTVHLHVLDKPNMPDDTEMP